jgi:hypothetical protein
VDTSADRIALPFSDLIAELKRCRFNVGVEQQLRLFRLLESLKGQCEPEQLKTLLCPIFATNEKQQAEFYRIFDAQYVLFYGSQSNRAERPNDYKVPGTDKGSRPSGTRIVRRRILLVAAVMAVIAMVLLALNYFTPAPTPKVLSPQQPTAPPPTAWSAVPQTIAGLIGTNRTALKWTSLALLLVGFAIWETIRYRRRNPSVARARPMRPPFRWQLSIQVPGIADYNSVRLSSVTRKLRRRQISDFQRLDIARTVAATIQGRGYPLFRFRPDSRFPEYLLLIERTTTRDHQAALFTQLARALEREHVFVNRFFFENDPRLCWSNPSAPRYHLIELQKKFPEHKLLIFSSAEKMLDPLSGELAAWTASLFEWRERAVLTPVPSSRWGFAERKLVTHFVIVPATLEGLDRLADRFDTGVRNGIEIISPAADGRAPENDSAIRIAEARRYLGEPVFQWLCACAIYPELHWELTVYLGSLAALGENLVTESNLLKLIQLPWFRAGSIPDAVRLGLIESLDSAKEQAAREAIVDLFKRSPAPSLDSYAYEDWRVMFVSQSALRYRRQPKRLKSELRKLSRAEIAQDYVLIRLLEEAPVSKVSLLLPRALRKIAFEKGVSLLGLTTVTRALVTLALIGVTWWSVDQFAEQRESKPVVTSAKPTPIATPPPTATVDERQKALIGKIVSLPEEQRRFLIETYQPGVAIPTDPRAQQKQLQVIVRKTTDPVTLSRMENDFSRPFATPTPVQSPTPVPTPQQQQQQQQQAANLTLETPAAK